MSIKPTFAGEMQLAGWSETHTGGCKVTSKIDGRRGAQISWASMRARCTNEAHQNYAYYGGRGISICERWNSFENFFADMGPRPERNSIDRIDPNGCYEPSNCRWVPASKQAGNRRFNHSIELNGEMLNLAELARRLGVPRARLLKRIKLGWRIEDVIHGGLYERHGSNVRR